LFNEKLGFSVIESGMGMPMVGRFAIDNSEKDVGKPIKNLYCSSYIYSKKIRNPDSDFCWREALKSAYGQTQYPKYTGLSANTINS
jgi:hypothetical protein